MRHDTLYHPKNQVAKRVPVKGRANIFNILAPHRTYLASLSYAIDRPLSLASLTGSHFTSARLAKRQPQGLAHPPPKLSALTSCTTPPLHARPPARRRGRPPAHRARYIWVWAEAWPLLPHRWVRRHCPRSTPAPAPAVSAATLCESGRSSKTGARCRTSKRSLENGGVGADAGSH